MRPCCSSGSFHVVGATRNRSSTCRRPKQRSAFGRIQLHVREMTVGHESRCRLPREAEPATQRPPPSRQSARARGGATPILRTGRENHMIGAAFNNGGSVPPRRITLSAASSLRGGPRRGELRGSAAATARKREPPPTEVGD